ncbi:ATP-binding protein [Streptomyces sp. NBC_01498]|uniref:ATP-binding protein n=1 Tax=Streptomyces sp. NBC_01498 TaxID=2975870 RepID=UPI002E7C0F13|nr:ATP-binding protein [Streptomyces sp. NBC_01498]WTL26091.1 ATP-binding protein [Streptomyces sp. NBC_01498]
MPTPTLTPVPPPPSPPQGGETYRLTVPNTANAPKIAREFLATLLHVSRHDALADDARLCVTELVTNAHRHTRTHLIGVTVAVNRKQVAVYVTDDMPWSLPVPNLTPTEQELGCGQGVFLLDRLAETWGSTIYGGPSPSYKAVWFTLARPEMPS